MHHEPVHAVPQAFDGEGVLAQQQRLELLFDNVRLFFGERAANANVPGVGLDLNEVGDVAIFARRHLLGPVGALCSMFGIDVDGANQSLFPEFAAMLQRAFHADDADFGNLHKILLNECGATAGEDCCPRAAEYGRWQMFERVQLSDT